MRLFSDSIGRKVVMAITGLLMVLFVIGHLLGNFSIFAHGINAYAEKLHHLPALVWGNRVVMGLAVIVHVILAIQVTMENQAAKPTKYKVERYLKATFAGRTMIWTGLILGAFIVYHLLQFTIRKTPGLVLEQDALNRFDVFTMVVSQFKVGLIALLYVVAMGGLFLHLKHGIQSTFQTLGLSNGVMLPRYGALGKVLSSVFLVGFVAIPVTIFFGILK
ncbi:succinate dehydrogenase cytochrome b subunit [Anaeromyxobacter oryzisoli]|uniref:succinate dehydrogenase cytochrome b subunit n=1 Tax=Anaeromyxobacter oryzisoli TaxID=2925408 RepID=UPI002413C904|nr:succinate dehydrogenase cytochrome b subunit [Anaeromyxobacter sp. SG63]